MGKCDNKYSNNKSLKNIRIRKRYKKRKKT